MQRGWPRAFPIRHLENALSNKETVSGTLSRFTLHLKVHKAGSPVWLARAESYTSHIYQKRHKQFRIDTPEAGARESPALLVAHDHGKLGRGPG